MSRTIYYGKTTKFVGKTLFEILANLRDFGVGRMVYRHTELQKVPQSYYVIRKVEPVMDEKLELGVAHVERVYDGAKVPGLVTIDEETWHTDWRLVPRDEEHLFRVSEEKLVTVGHPSKTTVLPRWMPVPPLMDIYLRRHFDSKKGPRPSSVRGLDSQEQPLEIRLRYLIEHKVLPNLSYRVAEEGEQPSSQFKTNIETLPPKFKQVNQNER